LENRGPEFHLQQHLKHVASWLSMPCWMLMSGSGASSFFSTSSTPSSSPESQEAQLGLQQLVLVTGGIQLLLGLLQFPADHFS
jgi:4-diphosphocytidyl-2C-methyl-D-erythritol kinase